MKHPQEYVDFLHKFMDMDTKQVRVDGLNREDWACLVMAAYVDDLPIDVRLGRKDANGSVFLVRKEMV